MMAKTEDLVGGVSHTRNLRRIGSAGEQPARTSPLLQFFGIFKNSCCAHSQPPANLPRPCAIALLKELLRHADETRTKLDVVLSRSMHKPPCLEPKGKHVHPMSDAQEPCLRRLPCDQLLVPTRKFKTVDDGRSRTSTRDTHPRCALLYPWASVHWCPKTELQTL